MADKTYDQVCEDATAAAEMRLLEHFKQHGGEADGKWFLSARLASLLETLSWSSSPKKADDAKTVGVASSIGINGSEVPGWFFTVDFETVRSRLELQGLVEVGENPELFCFAKAGLEGTTESIVPSRT
ncbi:unnamed protein product [Phytophthora lilii]|uniref:Unnamed protein product n=1 Tax=Phytophthora lilii TaxID=2077276 RepID=A0A9W6UED0_9STRA|nr:unnamed protein product [Phytophthora lilii]